MNQISREKALRSAADKAYEAGEMSAEEYSATRFEIDQNIHRMEADKPDTRGTGFEVVGWILVALGVLSLVLGDGLHWVALFAGGGLALLIGRVSRR